MTPEIKPQREPRGGNYRRALLIAVACVLWVAMLAGAVAFKWSEISQGSKTARRVPVATSPSWGPEAPPPVSPAPSPRPVLTSPTPAELETRARAGDAGAAHRLARLLEQQSPTAGTLKVAFEWRLVAAKAGDATAMAGVARGYRLGVGVERDPALAESWMERAVNAGGAELWDRIGTAFQYGTNLPQDFGEAAAWYRRALEKDLPSAQYHYASLLLQGRGVTKDVFGARSLLETAVAAGDNGARVTLAGTLTRDEPTDLPRARSLYRDAGKQKWSFVLIRHGLFCQNGIGGPRDLAMARREFQSAVDLGDATALMHLAEAMADSDAEAGVTADPGEARRLVERAAAKNNAAAKTALAKVERGMGLADALGIGGRRKGPPTMTESGFDMRSLDTIPRPVYQAKPRYPFSLRLLGVGGQVVVDFLVDREGRVQDAHAIRSTAPGFESAAVEAVSAWRFEPGRKDGAAVVTHMQVPIVFTLNEEAGSGRSR